MRLSPPADASSPGRSDLLRVSRGLVHFDLESTALRRIAGRAANRNLTRSEWREYFPGDDGSPRSYRRTFRDRPWPGDLPEAERVQGEQ